MKIIDVMLLQGREGVEFYTETPKTVTAVTHADETDVSEFHCVWKGCPRQSPQCVDKFFNVPRQKVELLIDLRYGMFYLIKVIPKFVVPLYPGKEFWLVAQANGRSGFLMPSEAVDEGEGWFITQREEEAA